MPWLRIEEKVTLVRFVEVNENTYPGETVEQAKDYERDKELGDKLENFAEALTYAIVESDVNDYIDNVGERPSATLDHSILVQDADEAWCNGNFRK